MDSWLSLLLADAILVLHVLFVAFVVLGLFTIYLGYFLKWSWVQNKKFRLIHLCSIAFVVIQSWLGAICPLTIWEMELRRSAQGETYSGSFIQYWLHEILYYTAPDWVFIVVYTVFGSMVVLSWFVVKPNT